MTLHLKRQNLISALLATFSALCFSVSMTLANQLSKDIPTSMVVFSRSFFGLMAILPFAIRNFSELQKISKSHLYVARILIAFSAMMCTYYAYRNLPISLATSIGMTGALFTTTLSWIILKNKVGFNRLILILLGYAGVIMIIRPNSLVLKFAIIIAIMANILASLIVIITKILSKDNSNISIMFYSTLGVVILSFMFAIKDFQSIKIRDLIILFCNGTLGSISQFCILNAIKLTNPVFVAPFEYIRIFFGITIGFFLFHEKIDMYMILGSCIIVLSTYSLTYTDDKGKENI